MLRYVGNEKYEFDAEDGKVILSETDLLVLMNTIHDMKKVQGNGIRELLDQARDYRKGCKYDIYMHRDCIR